ncbi:hypothetical protein HYH02_014202 [Chlamydomonas schloesseri]|uniref:non-specific serine/threonine protein kinase n=1 Tax=Chlamydomonas schloesseri TaxID=2026947 RepID=A0A835VX74_9CHLO|nr:hypothetical protein HYH02_014202 [Chlamydomonas schloesseri]|eukprot:KAG2428879.1 hypothetical protein HYH02_014202 [Chlamydomonas schloesseri]
MAVVASIGRQQGIAVKKFKTGIWSAEVSPAHGSIANEDRLGPHYRLLAHIWHGRGEAGRQPWTETDPSSAASSSNDASSCGSPPGSGDVDTRSSKDLSGVVVTTSQGLAAAAAAATASSDLTLPTKPAGSAGSKPTSSRAKSGTPSTSSSQPTTTITTTTTTATTTTTTRFGVQHDGRTHAEGGYGKVGFCTLTIETITASTAPSAAADPDAQPSTSHSTTTTIDTVRAACKRVAFSREHGSLFRQAEEFQSEVAAHRAAASAGLRATCGRHVCAFYQACCLAGHEGRIYMEPGRIDLYDLVGKLWTTGRGFVRETAICVVLASVLRGLRATHAAGWAHLDIKLENVVLGADGLLKLVDFGLARPIATATSATAASSSATSAATCRPAGTLTQVITSGTRGYKAPELIARGPLGRNPAKWLEEPTSGPAADVYSLGCMAFYMAASKEHRPLVRNSANELTLPVSAEIREKVLRRLPPTLSRLITAMISTQPSARPGVEAALAHPALRGYECEAARRWRW